MEMISRRAYGFWNFENFRLRVRALCCFPDRRPS
jgi:transposase